ncbi:hypothetical protein L596_000087 [Steinernema carpocapsae]|uniref:Uncharacterized protein n=1 Tax=Steinernema carpocapsae TaxID=34508 RepID=A0A4V6I702_STECR|nr:hypothetical protein L596_000087 [Steinernema carpocapsae]
MRWTELDRPMDVSKRVTARISKSETEPFLSHAIRSLREPLRVLKGNFWQFVSDCETGLDGFCPAGRQGCSTFCEPILPSAYYLIKFDKLRVSAVFSWSS